jgi:hypothetical protein
MVSACLRIPVRSSFALAMVVFLFVAVPVQAQIESSGFPVLQLDASARTAALGGASSALLESNSTALFSNPALLSPSAHKSLSFSYLNHLSDINAGWLSYARNVDSLGTLAVGVRYVSFGSFDETDERGEKIGTFGASDVALTVGGARTWRTNWRVGVGVNLMRSSIASNAATAASLDGGLVFAKPGSLSSFSASAHNLGLVFSSIGQRSDSLPLDVRLGFTQKLAHLPLLVSVTAYRLHKLDGGDASNKAVSSLLNHIRLAGEFQFSSAFQVRFGYDHRKHQDLKVKSRLDMSGFSTGVGIVIAKVRFDYSFNSWSSLGALHRFSVSSSL